MPLELFMVPLKNVNAAEAELNAFLRGPRVRQRFGVAANGLEPRDPRRQLEQRRDELPDGEPQQQQPGQREQQPWFPGCAGPSSTGGLENSQADPATILSSKRSVPRQRTADAGLVLVAESGSAKPPGLSLSNAQPTENKETK